MLNLSTLLVIFNVCDKIYFWQQTVKIKVLVQNTFSLV